MIHLVLRLPRIRPLTWTLTVGPLRLNFGPVALRLFKTLSFPNIGLITSSHCPGRGYFIQDNLNFEIHPRPAADAQDILDPGYYVRWAPFAATNTWSYVSHLSIPLLVLSCGVKD